MPPINRVLGFCYGIFATRFYSTALCGNNAKDPKLVSKFVLCKQKMLCQKGGLNCGFHVSKTMISTAMTKNVTWAPVKLDKDNLNEHLYEHLSQTNK